MAEWGSEHDYATRVANLQGQGSGPRYNGSFFLTMDGPIPTVLDDHVSGRAALRQVGAGARVACTKGVEGSSRRRQNGHAAIGEQAPDLAGRVDAVHDRHLEVHQDDVGAPLAGEPYRLLAVAGVADDLEPLVGAEREPEGFGEEVMVVRDQDADLGLRRLGCHAPEKPRPRGNLRALVKDHPFGVRFA